MINLSNGFKNFLTSIKKLNLKKERKTARKTARKNNERQRNYKNRVQYSITERTRRYKWLRERKKKRVKSKNKDRARNNFV